MSGCCCQLGSSSSMSSVFVSLSCSLVSIISIISILLSTVCPCCSLLSFDDDDDDDDGYVSISKNEKYD